MESIWLAFITGLTTGGISCFAVQGGLLAGALAQQEKENHKNATYSFLISKLIAYTLLGGLLGLAGSALVISPKVQGLMQMLAGVFMLIAVGQLLDLHPIFKRFIITPPKSVYRILRTSSKNEGLFAPAVLGFLTVLIPCGVTQSIMLLSVSTGSAFYGALILGAFTLGTSPVFFGLGIASKAFLQKRALKYLAAGAITYLAIMSINTGQILRGSAHTLQNYWTAAFSSPESVYADTKGKVAGVNADGMQEVDVNVFTSSYQTTTTTLKVNVPVKLNLITNRTFGCSRAFTIPSYNISKILPETGTTAIEFTPTKKGRLTYSCSMGMYTGYFEVI